MDSSTSPTSWKTPKNSKRCSIWTLISEKARNEKSKKKQNETDISKILKTDQPVLVQVVKEPIGTKGARLTSNVSIAGRYLVLLPNTPHRGVSRKIEDRAARERLKKLIQAFEMPQDMGLICRTASVNATQEQLIARSALIFSRLARHHGEIRKIDQATCLYEESDLIKRAVLTAIDKKFERILIDDYATYQRCKQTLRKYSAEHPLKDRVLSRQDPDV